MTILQPLEIETEAEPDALPRGPLRPFTCVRCGYTYHKDKDYEPYLCYRCMRYIAKNVYKVMEQIQPPISRPDERKDI